MATTKKNTKSATATTSASKTGAPKRTKKAPAKKKTEMKKYCGRCERTRAGKFFGSNACRKDGLADWCKECYGAWRKARNA